jgi:hypothetical protein
MMMQAWVDFLEQTLRGGELPCLFFPVISKTWHSAYRILKIQKR